MLPVARRVRRAADAALLWCKLICRNCTIFGTVVALGTLRFHRYVLENLITVKKNVFWILGFFVRDKRAAVLGELLIDFTTPNPKAKGETSGI